MNSPSPSPPAAGSRRWVTWLTIILFLIFIACLIVWLFLKSFVQTKIQTQLQDLDLGDTEIGNISVASDGVTAHNIEFKRSPDDAAPWLKVGRLKIEHPLADLASGATTFDHIEVTDAQATVNLEEFLTSAANTGDAAPAFDLSQIKLPAKEISVSDTNLRILDGEKSLDVAGVNLRIQQDDATQKISGDVADLLGGAWQIEGRLDPSNNSYTANLSSTELKLDNEKWQSLPYLPKNLSKYFTASGSVDVSADITGNAQTPLVIDGTANINELDLNLPNFDLPITVSAGDVAFNLDEIKTTNLRATIDGQDKITASTTTNIASFPISTDFESKFADLSIDALRKIVPAIPEILTARADGTASGSVIIEEDLRTTIKIDAEGRTESARYGGLAARSSQTSVVIESLVFDAQQNYESISGTLIVDAAAAEQPLSNVFTTFDIEPLYEQLDLEGIVQGQAKINLPLATIGDLRTWGLVIEGQMPTGKLASQTITNARVTGQLNNGILELSPLTAIAGNAIDATPADDAPVTNVLRADITWPLIEDAIVSKGSIVLSGENLPTPWTVGLIQNQIFKATGEHLVAEDSKLANQIKQLKGNVNFDAKINIPVDQPDAVTRWTADATVTDSTLTVQKQSLRNLWTKIKLSDGKLQFTDLSGDFEGNGFLTGDAVIDLTETAAHEVNIDAQKVPLLWLITVGKNASPEFAQQFNQAVGISEDETLTADTASGELNFKIAFVTLPPESALPWNASLKVRSNELTLVGESFKKVNIEASSDSKRVIVKQLKANFGPRGVIDGGLEWDLQGNTGDGEVAWKSLSLKTISQIAKIEGLPVTGSSDGRLKITPLDPEDDLFDQLAFPIDVEGQIAVVDLTAASIRVKPFKFDIATRTGTLHIENFRTQNEAIDFDLNAKADLIEPFRFTAQGAVGKLQLSRLLKQSSVTHKEGEVADVSGVMFGKFQFDGQLYPLDIHTNGKLKIKSPSYNNKPYQDIFVEWDHLGNDWNKSKLVINAFGGDIKMVELVQKPQRVKLKISNIDAVQVTSLFDLPVELTGTLEGAASLNDWDLTDTRWAELEMRGSSMLISEVKIGKFSAKANYRAEQLIYGIEGALLGGKFEGQGEAAIGDKRLEKIEFPMEFKLTNALLEKLNRKSNLFRSFRELDGNLSATAKFIVGLDRPFEGDGRITISDAKWSNELLTRLASIHFNLSQGRIIFNDVQADLKRGSIKASAMIPLSSNLAGNYECDIRQMDLARIAAIVSDEPLEIEGLFDARLNGQIGKTISGQGYIGVDRASLHGVNGQSVRLPIQFSVSTANGSGRAELRRSTFRLFDGSVSGTAKVTFGSRLTLNTDLKLSRIDTGKMMRSLADFDQADQGELNGRLKIKGSGIRSLRDLKGTFEGNLERASAFQLPVLTDMARVLGGNRIQNDDFASQDIYLQLDNGRVEVKNLNLSSSLANVAIAGFIFVDGRLDLEVAGRIERFNQPTLIEQLAGSPLTLIRGTPASFFAQAADFISDRVVFLHVGGTVDRPQVRVDTRQQLREETIRYFLRGSQILPYEGLRNN